MPRTFDKYKAWIEAAGKTSGISGTLLKRIALVANYMSMHGEAPETIRGIDTSKPIEIVTLAKSALYVQYKCRPYKGKWFTNTGVSIRNLGISEGHDGKATRSGKPIPKRTRAVFEVTGSVKALKSTARSITDTWTKARDQYKIDPTTGRAGEMVSGGGTQYYVASKYLSKMKER